MRSLPDAAVCLCVLLLTLALPLSGAAESEPAKDGKSKIAFETDVIDLGEVTRGQKLEYVFSFENTGKADLEVQSVKPSCGCTVARFDPLTKPGKKGRIVATVNTRTLRGPVTKTITVTSNDPVDSTVQLKTKATVKSLIDVLPSESVYFRIYKNVDEPTRKVVTLRADKENRFEVKSIKSTNKHLLAKLLDKPASNKDGITTYQIELDIAKDTPVGRLKDAMVKVATTHPKKPEIIIRANAQVMGQIVVTPLKVYLGKIAPKRVKKTKRTVRVHKRNATDFQIKKFTSSNPAFKLEQNEVEPGQTYTLTLSLDPELVKPGAISGEIRIVTNDKDERVLKVPVYGTLAAGKPPKD